MTNVAPGSQLVIFAGEASFRVANAALYVVCRTRVNGAVVSNVKAVVGDAATGSSVLTDIASIVRDTPFDLSVTCSPADQAGMGVAPAIEGPKLAVVRLDSITPG